MNRPEFELGSSVYRFEDLTLGQMELLAGLMHESRKAIFKELVQTDEPTVLARLTISIADVMHDLRRSGTLSDFIAVCMLPKGGTFDAKTVAERSAAFKALPYDKGEEVIEFFFTTGGFAKLLMPAFLTTPSAAPGGGPGGSTKSKTSSGSSSGAVPEPSPKSEP